MAQRKSHDSTIGQVIELVARLSSDEQDHVVCEIKSRWGIPLDEFVQWKNARTQLPDERRDIVLDTQRKVLQLVGKLPSDEQDKLLDELKVVWLRQAVKEGEESLDLHGGIPVEQVFAELRERAQQRLRDSRDETLNKPER